MRMLLRNRIQTSGFAIAAMVALFYGVGASVRATGTDAAAPSGGRDLFEVNCASCHGATGQGNGPAAAALRQRPANLTLYAIQNGGTFPTVKLHRIIDGRDVVAHGSSDMPVWGNAFKASPEHPSEDIVKARIDSIVQFLESIQVRHG